MKLRKTLLGALAAAAMLPVTANAAISWVWNYAGLNTAEGFAAPTTGPISAPIDELKFTSESIINWTSGVPFAAGSTFDDYILLRIDQYNHASTNVTEPTYGAGFPGFGIPGDHEFTVKLRLSGVQTGVNTYTVTSMAEFGLYYDSGAAGAYTHANFVAGTEGFFSDSTLAETGALILGNGSNTSAGLPDGSIDLVVALADNLHNIVPGQVTELLPVGGLLIPIPLAVGIADGNNNLCGDDGGTAVCTDTEASLRAYWGLGGVPSGLTFHTRSDGSINKDVLVIPEPGSLALVGLGLLGFGFAGRRKSKAA